MPSIHLLDEPMWNSLNTAHSNFAVGKGLARAYLPAIGPLSGLAEQTPAAYDDLLHLAAPNGVHVLFLHEPPVPRDGWTLIRGGLIDQMVFDGSGSGIANMPPHEDMRLLTAADVPAMVELATLTEPGPFRDRTHELGAFYGIFEGGRLLAMAGQRMRVPGSIEVSAVCTHPDARGRGYARILMSAVMKLILDAGDTPFLHTFADNHSAIRVYHALGYKKRITFHLAVLKKT
jgi:ribosomal protein S18 acetylase RimI-like enzyme